MEDRFTRIRIAGFRRLRDVDLPLRDLAIVIGPNGSGKTTFLDAWNLLGAAAEGKLSKEISARGGFSEIVTRDSSAGLGLEVDRTDSNLGEFRYAIALRAEGISYVVENEELLRETESDADDLLSRLTAGTGKPGRKKTESVLGLFSTLNPRYSRLREAYTSHRLFTPIDTRAKSAIRTPQRLEPANDPGVDGETLASCLYQWKDSDPQRFESVEDTLKAAFPDFEKLGFPAVAAGMLAMTWKDRTFSRPLYMHQLSEGTLRFLWLTTLLQSPDLPAVTLIDEPEVSLHPELLKLLVDLMREASRRTQLIVATHSDRLIRFAEPKEVLVSDIVDGSATFTWADTMDLDEWLAEYSLDQVWQMGRMGGRP